MDTNSTQAEVCSSEGLGLVERLSQCLPTMDDGPDHKTWCSVLGSDLRAAVGEIQRLRGRFGEAADKAMTYAESYEMAVARLVLAMDYMHPEQKRAFNAAWAEKRAELRAVALRA